MTSTTAFFTFVGFYLLCLLAYVMLSLYDFLYKMYIFYKKDSILVRYINYHRGVMEYSLVDGNLIKNELSPMYKIHYLDWTSIPKSIIVSKEIYNKWHKETISEYKITHDIVSKLTEFEKCYGGSPSYIYKSMSKQDFLSFNKA